MRAVNSPRVPMEPLAAWRMSLPISWTSPSAVTIRPPMSIVARFVSLRPEPWVQVDIAPTAVCTLMSPRLWTASPTSFRARPMSSRSVPAPTRAHLSSVS